MTALVLHIVVTVLICIFLLCIVKQVFKVLLKKSNRIHLHFFKSMLEVVIVIVCIYGLLSTFEVTKDFGKVILQSGTLFIAILTFAAQKALDNIIGGFSISMTRPFEVGQKIKVVNGSNVIAEGIITNITIRHTTIRHFDGQTSIIPNSIMDSSVIVNTNFTENVGNFLEVEVGYDSDIDIAKKIIIDLYNKEPLTINKDSVAVYTSRFTENGVILKITIWTKTLDDNFLACSNLRENIVKEFNKFDITIPYHTITISKSR